MGRRTGTGDDDRARSTAVSGLGAGGETSGSAISARAGLRIRLARGLRRPLPVVLLLIALCVAVSDGAWVAGIVKGDFLVRLNEFAALPSAAVVGVLGWRMKTHAGMDARSGRGWSLIGVGMIAFATGYAAILLGETARMDGLSAAGRIVQLTVYPTVGLGASQLARPFERKSDTILAWLDVCIIAWSTAMIVWHFAFFPLTREAHGSTADAFFAALAPVGDLALVFAIAAVILRGVRSASQDALTIVLGGLLLMFGADVVTGIEHLRGVAASGFSGAFYGLAWLVVSVGAFYQWTHRSGAPARDLARYRRSFQWLPYVAVVVAFVAPALYHWDDKELLEQHIPATGLLMGMLVARLMVTARQNAAFAAAERVQLHTAVAQAAEAIVLTDRDWKVSYTNGALTRMTGHDPAEVIGRDLSFVHPDPDKLAEMRAAVERGEIWHGRVSHQRPEAPAVEIDMTVSPVRDEAGLPAGSVLLARDITRERALETQLAQTQRMEAVGRLAGGIAHDFNNILTAISGFSELALGSLSDDHPARADLQEVLRGSDRAAALTRDLLAFSRRQVMQARLLDLNDVLEGLRSMLERTLGEDVALRFGTQDGLGQTIADRSQIEQVVLNLAMNARDAMPTGGTLTIATANADLDEAYARSHLGTVAGQFVSLTVSDTGTGMPPDVLLHVFEPFFTTKPRSRSNGLGLSTVAGVVEQSGGFILAESSVGSGSVFRVFLPRVAAPEAKPEEIGGLAGGNETILVAEDEAPVRRVIERVLTAAGYRVYVASNGHEALAMAPTLPHLDLLLTDVVMPGMSGVDLARQLALSRPDLRIIFASGYTGDSLIRVGAKGSMPYLDKPFAAETLLTRVREVLDAPVETPFD